MSDITTRTMGPDAIPGGEAVDVPDLEAQIQAENEALASGFIPEPETPAPSFNLIEGGGESLDPEVEGPYIQAGYGKTTPFIAVDAALASGPLQLFLTLGEATKLEGQLSEALDDAYADITGFPPEGRKEDESFGA